MVKQDNYYKAIKEIFEAGETSIILKTIAEIKHSGKAEIMPLIFNLLQENSDNEVHNAILVLLSQLNLAEVVPYIIDEIQNDSNQKYKREVITSCWQSGLDFSAYIDVFARCFVKADYETAIECFTVIEEWIHNSSKEHLTQSKSMLVQMVSEVDSTKKPLYIELVKLLESAI